MTTNPFAHVRLRALLGNGEHPLPASFLPQLEQLLAQGRLMLAASNDAEVQHNRNLQALDAVLEVLEAAELERDSAGNQGLLGDHVVHGLLVAARQLTAAVVTSLPNAHPAPAMRPA